MYDKESLKKQYREIFKDWSEEKIDKHAEWMAKKYSTLKSGENVVHLEYIGGMIDDNDISEIENAMSKSGLELSRFDRNGVAYASLEDFSLQSFIALNNVIVQSVLLGLATNVVWDAIKLSAHLVWKRIKMRHWGSNAKERKLNFGLNITLANKSSIELKISGDFKEETVLQALDKIIPLLEEENNKPPRRFDNFFEFDEVTQQWVAVDVMEEYLKAAMKQKTKIEEK